MIRLACELPAESRVPLARWSSSDEAELVLASKYAVLQAAGYKRPEIARMLDAGPAALRNAEQRVKSAATRLDHGD